MRTRVYLCLIKKKSHRKKPKKTPENKKNKKNIQTNNTRNLMNKKEFLLAF